MVGLAGWGGGVRVPGRRVGSGTIGRMTSESPRYADRIYRSGASLLGGVLLLALIAWLGIDALVRGETRARLLALSGMLLLVPLVVALALRPAVFAGEDRLRVRNPFRTLVLPWSVVEGVRAGLSVEVLADGRRYALWAIPVSLRQRKKAARRAERAERAARGEKPRGALAEAQAAADRADGFRAPSDQAVDELNELAERNASREAAQGAVRLRWAYELIVPAVVGAVALAVLLAVG